MLQLDLIAIELKWVQFPEKQLQQTDLQIFLTEKQNSNTYKKLN